MSIAAMKQALDALYDIDATGVPVGHIDLVIDTLRLAIELAERGPVVGTKTTFEDGELVVRPLYHDDVYNPPPAAPVQEPVANLTVEQGRVAVAAKILPDGVYDLYTTPPQRQPDYVWCGCGDGIMPNTGAKCGTCASIDAAPPQREWAGLTDGEIDALHSQLKVQLLGTFSIKDIYRTVEAALQEKNA
jgi:hypothetical protein